MNAWEPPFDDAELARLAAEVEDGATPAAPARPASSAPQPATLVTVNMATIAPRPVDWLWKGWLARGKLHILGGHPGDGKSTLATAVAATLSTASAWPDGSRAPAATIAALIAEDGLDDTFSPRLALHDANMTRIDVIRWMREADGRLRLPDLSRDHVALERGLAGVDLLIVDPLTGYMPGADRNAEGSVRDVLTPLTDLAERTGIAILAIMHVGKPSGTARRPLQQLLGATAFGALARLVWMVAPLPGAGDEAERKVLAVVKSNLAIRPPGLVWSRPLDGAIQWHGEAPQSIETLLSESGAATQPRPREEAAEFLLDILSDTEPLPANAVRALAADAGIATKTLYRAADALGVLKRKQVDGWGWMLPPSKMVTSVPGEVAILTDQGHGESKVVTSPGMEVTILTDQGTEGPRWPLPEVTTLTTLDGNEPKMATSIGTEVTTLNDQEDGGVKMATSSGMEVTTLTTLDGKGHAGSKMATSSGTEVTTLTTLDGEEHAGFKMATSSGREVTILNDREDGGAKMATSIGKEVAILRDTRRPGLASGDADDGLPAADEEPEPDPLTVARAVELARNPPGYDHRHELLIFKNEKLNRAVAAKLVADAVHEQDPWAEEPAEEMPARVLPLPAISGILRIEERAERQALLRRHPVETRQAAIDWHRARNTNLPIDVWEDLTSLEVDDTTLPPEAVATPDRLFCAVCGHLLSLPADRAHGYHQSCAA